MIPTRRRTLHRDRLQIARHSRFTFNHLPGVKESKDLKSHGNRATNGRAADTKRPMDVKQSPRSDGKERVDQIRGVVAEVSGRPIPDEKRRAAFLREATPELRRNAEGFARRRARGDAAYAEEMVQDVLGDTWLGVVSWDPDRVSLQQHVLSVIASRTGHDHSRAQRFPHVSLEVLDETEMTEVEDALAKTASVSNAEDALATARTLAKARELAAADRKILSLIEAICAGYTERADLLRVTGMSKRTYRATRRRLGQLLESLPHTITAVRSRTTPLTDIARPVDPLVVMQIERREPLAAALESADRHRFAA